MLHLESRINWNQQEPLESWLDHAIVAIAPNGDYLLMSGRTPEPSTLIAKLRKEPINQYVVKPLNVGLDMDEHVTSLLCLPIMSTQKTALGSVDWTVFVIGFSSGYVKFYSEQSNCLLSLKFCDESILSIKCQTRKVNTNARSECHFATLSDEILIVHKSSAIVIDGLSLFENLRIAKGEIIRNGLDYEPAYSLKDMPSILHCHQWKLDPESEIVDGELLGTRLTTTFDAIKNKSINPSIVGPKPYARTFAVIGSRPFLSCYRESPDSTTHSYTEMIGSLLSMWNKTPEPTRFQMNEITKSTPQSFYDRERRATSIVASPDKRLLAITDDFGRILLVDVTNWLIIRMWKGYRSAQCGWVEVKKDPDSRTTAHATFLIIYAPKRGLLEVWAHQRGPRIAAMNVGKSCKLLYSGYKMLNMRMSKQEIGQALNATTNLVEQSYSTHCYLLNGQSEIVSCLNLPYTYSLYKKTDFKSRDKLLIGELYTAIEQDAQTDIHSDIIHRLSLPDSIENAIEMVSLDLSEDKVLVIMENLINKTMRNYDNHPGEVMTADDKHIIELCKRIIKLCALYGELSQLTPRHLALPEVDKSLVQEYDEHPREVDEFAQKLGWSAQEVLRYLSLGALERSFIAHESHTNPWPNLGEPLLWTEFIRCFDILSKTSTGVNMSKSGLSIRLRRLDHEFLSSDQVLKTSLFLYNRISETYYQKTVNSTQDSLPLDECEVQKLLNHYNYIEPSSRLALLFQFWLSTSLCKHWKMWAFIQAQVDRITDELRVISIERNEDSLLVNIWKRIYQLILESDNLYAAIIGTACLKVVTIRTIQDNEKREKLSKKIKEDGIEDVKDGQVDDEVDWEMLCIDAERMSIVGQQLEDVFLLSLLLKYSFDCGSVVKNHQYKVARISVANILRSGPTIVSELVAQWVSQSKVNLKTITQSYGRDRIQSHSANTIVFEESSTPLEHKHNQPLDERRRFRLLKDNDQSNDDQAKELLHHVRTAFPRSLEPDVVLVYCIWECCTSWSSGLANHDKLDGLRKILDSLRCITAIELSHKLSTIAYKSFFQFTFERLVSLVEINSTLVTIKNARIRDGLTRKELNMSEDCLEEFVEFCLLLTDFMMQSMADLQMHLNKSGTNKGELANKSAQGGTIEKRNLDDDVADCSDNMSHLQQVDIEDLQTFDDWWQTGEADGQAGSSSGNNGATSCYLQPYYEGSLSVSQSGSQSSLAHSTISRSQQASLVRTTLNCSNIFTMEQLVELNKLATLMNLIFKLKITKAYPKSLIGEESRQILQLDLRQSPSSVGSGAQLQSVNMFHRPNNSDPASQQQLATSKHAKRAPDVNELRSNFARKCIHSVVRKLDDESNEFDEDTCKRELAAINTKNRISNNTSDPSSSDLFSVNKTKVNKKQLSSTDVGRDITMSGAANDLSTTTLQTKHSTSRSDAMRLFAQLLSLANDWRLDRDELHLEFVFELYRCNHDKLASELAHRIVDQQTLAKGLLKIASQRTLLLAGLSPQLSGSKWRLRTQAWSLFVPNLANWLKTIQAEEMKREIAALGFSDSLRVGNPIEEDNELVQLGLFDYVLQTVRLRTKILLDKINNNLSGAEERLARELMQVLDSPALIKMINQKQQNSGLE